MIVKVTSYIKPGRTAKAKAKATVRYLMHRPNREGERVTRELFNTEGPLEKRHAYSLIDQARRGAFFYRLTISPDPRREDTHKDLNLWTLTQSALRLLQEALGKELEYVAVVHGDQTAIRHVNLLLLVPGRLSYQQFRALPKILREKAWLEARRQRELLDPKRERVRIRLDPAPEAPPPSNPPSFRENKYRGALSLRPLKPLCPECGTSAKMWRVAAGRYLCLSCGSAYQEHGFSGGLEREEGRAR